MRACAKHLIRKVRGLTLVEMLVSLSVLSIIVVACGSTMRLMTRNLAARDNNPTTQAAAARAAVDQITDDLNLALSIPEMTPSALTITVPDRNGDGQPETIRYAWSGVAGAPLTVQYNGGTPVSLAENVQALNFTSFARTVGPPGPVESSEQLLASYDAATTKAFVLTNKNWPGEYFKPALPANATAWKITRVKLQLVRTGTTGSFLVQLSTANGTFFDSSSASVASAPSTLSWVEFPFSNAANLDPSQFYGIAVTSSSIGSLINVAYDDKPNPPPANWTFYSTTNSGGSWTPGTYALTMYVYGTVTTPAP